MISQVQLHRIVEAASQHPEVGLLYLFGSQASGDTGPLSDYDFAVYLDEPDHAKLTNLRFELLHELSRILQSDDIDLVLLNRLDKPALGYNIITTGRLLFERESYRLKVEPQILNEYFDFQALLERHNLTKVAAVSV